MNTVTHILQVIKCFSNISAWSKTRMHSSNLCNESWVTPCLQRNVYYSSSTVSVYTSCVWWKALTCYCLASVNFIKYCYIYQIAWHFYMNCYSLCSWLICQTWWHIMHWLSTQLWLPGRSSVMWLQCQLLQGYWYNLCPLSIQLSLWSWLRYMSLYI